MGSLVSRRFNPAKGVLAKACRHLFFRLDSGKLLVAVSFFLLMHAGVVSGQEEVRSDFKVVDSAFCPEDNLQDKWCIKSGNQFPPEIDRLYCCTKIQAEVDGEIYHNWIFNGETAGSVRLTVLKSSGYRTRSYKTIPPTYSGDWKVEVVADGILIETLNFTIKPLVELPSISANSVGTSSRDH